MMELDDAELGFTSRNSLKKEIKRDDNENPAGVAIELHVHVKNENSSS
jgi:hypothetical protein